MFAISQEKSVATAFLFYFGAKRSDVLRESNHVFILLFTFCWYEQVKYFVK